MTTNKNTHWNFYFHRHKFCKSFVLLRCERQQVPPNCSYPPVTLQAITAQRTTLNLNILSWCLACLLVSSTRPHNSWHIQQGHTGIIIMHTIIFHWIRGLCLETVKFYCEYYIKKVHTHYIQDHYYRKCLKKSHNPNKTYRSFKVISAHDFLNPPWCWPNQRCGIKVMQFVKC